MSELLCKGNCGNKVTFSGWCKIKWRKGNRFAVGCPAVELLRGQSISKFRTEEARLGKNPMQNHLICVKNHTKERNLKASLTLKELGRKGLLPQQIELGELKEKRRKNVSIALRKLFEVGQHPLQKESLENRRKRFEKIATTLTSLGKQGKLPVQNMTLEQKEKFGQKISKTLIKGLKSGRIKLSRGWKKVPYKGYVLRSFWEKEVAEFLDKIGITWEYESLKIPYWNSDKNKETLTIPDFYIPSLNTVIEVKSNAKFKSQETKDKMEGIKKLGFSTVLIGRKEIESIKNYKSSKLMGAVI